MPYLTFNAVKALAFKHLPDEKGNRAAKVYLLATYGGIDAAEHYAKNQREIAKLLGCSERTVRYDLADAKQIMEDVLEDNARNTLVWNSVPPEEEEIETLFTITYAISHKTRTVTDKTPKKAHELNQKIERTIDQLIREQKRQRKQKGTVDRNVVDNTV